VIPLALIIGVLLASVMVMGSLGEHYELSSMKSAGVSLLRIMRPIVLFCGLIAAFSFACSNVFSPWAKVKYNSRLYDLRRQKPTLSIEEGVFNDSFSGFAMRIGKKDRDNVGVHDIMVYENKGYGSIEKMSEVMAKDGKIYSSDNKQFLIMDLYDGIRYEKADDPKRQFAFVRTVFKSWKKVFDMSQFDISRTDDNLFKSGAQAKAIHELKIAADSITREIGRRKENNVKQIQASYFTFSDTIKSKSTEISLTLSVKPMAVADSSKTLNDVSHFVDYFEKSTRAEILGKAQRACFNLKDQCASTISSADKLREARVKFVHEMNYKFVLAFMCIVFVMVGVPMGAIVRKGGFGFPLLISVSFFIVFIFMSLMFRKLAEQGTMSGELAAWAPLISIGLFGLLAMRKALKDKSLFQDTWLEIIFQTIGKFIKSKFLRFKKA
jgi:lipopolysaccharide export system permease protein